MSRKLQSKSNPGELIVLRHELGVFQEELEMQNRQLQESQRLLEQSRDRYAELYDFAPVAMLTLCEEGVIREVNLTSANLLGDARRALLEMPFILFVIPSYRSAFLQHLRRCRAGDAEVNTYLVIKNRKGRQIPIELSSNQVARKDESRKYYYSALVDLTQNEAREAAESANRLKDQFLATVSHELRTPLSAVLLWSHLLKSGAVAETDRAEALTCIYENAQSQSRIIDDLLDLARLMSGKIPINLQEMNLVPVVHQAVESLRPQAVEKALRLELFEVEKELWVQGDPVRLRQVIFNLLSNAIKFTPGDGQIMVRLSEREGAAELVVRDNGIGIASDLLPHVFDRFRQGDSSITRAQGGLGLGLSIVRQLVELHGGTVRASSGGQSTGSTFTVELPLIVRAKKARQKAKGRKRANHHVLEGKRVLVVEDETVTRKAVHRLLEDAGAVVQSVENSQAALRAMKTKRPDVLLSDLAMPGEDGLWLIRRVREQERSTQEHVPAASMSAHALDTDRQAALDAGFEVHLAKPVDPEELVSTVEKLALQSGGSV